MDYTTELPRDKLKDSKTALKMRKNEDFLKVDYLLIHSMNTIYRLMSFFCACTSILLSYMVREVLVLNFSVLMRKVISLVVLVWKYLLLCCPKAQIRYFF